MNAPGSWRHARELREACPRFLDHTPMPEDYVMRSEWADEKAKTHRQVRCVGCNLFAIWIPLLSSPAAGLAPPLNESDSSLEPTATRSPLSDAGTSPPG